MLEKQVISSKDLLRALEYQDNLSKKLGEIAVEKCYMTKEQVKQIQDEQHKMNNFFGKLAIQFGYINEKQLEEIITYQKNNHIYLGEALVELGIMSKETLNRELKIFEKQNRDDAVDLKIPFDIKEKDIIPKFADLTIKLFERIADIKAKPGDVLFKEGGMQLGDFSAFVNFDGAYKLKYLITVSMDIARKVACEYIGEKNLSGEMLKEGVKEFSNVICGNLVTALEKDGKKCNISVPHIVKGKELGFETNEKAISIPFTTTYGYCEVALIIPNIGAIEMTGAEVKKVLIVDDSKSVAFKLTKIIENMPGFEVAGHALSGEEAIKLYEKIKPDLVTMDIVLPEMSGIEAIKIIKNKDKDANIVVISSVGGGQQRLFEAIQAGAKNVITKPFNEETVKNVFTQSLI